MYDFPESEIMSLSREDVEKIAALARLELEPEELTLFQEQLSACLAYVAMLNQVDITGVPPTASAVTLNNVMREDVIEPSLSAEEALFNTAERSGNQFKIQPVLDED